jgi:hypothetical protein
MTKQELKEKLELASEIIESWPEWKKNSLKDSFRSRNSTPREEVVLHAESPADSKSAKD